MRGSIFQRIQQFAERCLKRALLNCRLSEGLFMRRSEVIKLSGVLPHDVGEFSLEALQLAVQA
ncbi:MAG: hypothetical protein WDO74_06950 [Pseudomonadota bacterium]